VSARRARSPSAVGATLYLGADVELANGVWTKYLHADVKVVGTGGLWLGAADSRRVLKRTRRSERGP
jgi:hypothetical protein